MEADKLDQIISLLTEIRDYLARDEVRALVDQSDFEDRMIELVRDQIEKGHEIYTQEKLLASERNRNNAL